MKLWEFVIPFYAQKRAYEDLFDDCNDVIGAPSYSEKEAKRREKRRKARERGEL